MRFKLDHDRLIHLDAEALAETGICEAYEQQLPELRKYVPQPAQVGEVSDNHTPRYSVRYKDNEYAIYGPELLEAEDNSWGRATFAFFLIINDQLAGSEHRFYAINCGNDLEGTFLTPAQARAAQDSLPNKSDWPYLPTNEPPWYGQYH
jgi:hypothetical protein